MTTAANLGAAQSGSAINVNPATRANLDSGDPAAKIELRRYMLRKYHAAKPPDVLDACAGHGDLWRHLRKTQPVGSYVAIDRRHLPGVIIANSTKYLAERPLDFDVLDIDSYGEPYRHLALAAPNLRRDAVTVFLTVGGFRRGRTGTTSHFARSLLGLVLPTPAPIALCANNSLSDYIINAALCYPVRFGFRITEAAEADSIGNARYFGVHYRRDQ